MITPREVEPEDTARDQRNRRGSYKGALGKGRQTIALDIDKPDLCPSNVSAGSSNGTLFRRHTFLFGTFKF